MKLSNHSKQRMKERTDYNHKDRRTLFRNALDKGYIFIYSKNSKRLYTMYKLKDKYLEGSELNG